MKSANVKSKRAFALIASVLCLAGSASGQAENPPARLDAGGCRLERVTDAGADDGHFQFHGPTRDGRTLLVGTYRGKTQGAYLLDLGTGRRTDLPGLNNAGVLSEDASRALVANMLADGSTEIVEQVLATGTQRAVAPHPKSDFLATYSPDGTLILFNSYRSGKSDIYIVPRAGGEVVRLTDFEGYDAHADFAPDMSRIVFHRNIRGDDYDIYQIDFKTKAVSALITGAGEQAYPAWSPDGRWIAYVSNSGGASGQNDIFAARSDGSAPRRLTHEPGQKAYPSWSPDSRYLYFNDQRDGKVNVFRLALDGNGGCAGVE